MEPASFFAKFHSYQGNPGLEPYVAVEYTPPPPASPLPPSQPQPQASVVLGAGPRQLSAIYNHPTAMAGAVDFTLTAGATGSVVAQGSVPVSSGQRAVFPAGMLPPLPAGQYAWTATARSNDGGTATSNWRFVTTTLNAESDELGVEPSYGYSPVDLGVGAAHVNLGTGNLVASYPVATVPAQGVNVDLSLHYNSQAPSTRDHGSGRRWSLALSGAVPEAVPGAGEFSVDVHHPVRRYALNSDGTTAPDAPDGDPQVYGYILEVVDGDGTLQRFIRRGPPGSRWDSPPGVNVRVVEVFASGSSGPVAGYSLFRPDGVMYRVGPTYEQCDTSRPLGDWRVNTIGDRSNNSVSACYSNSTATGGRTRLVRLFGNTAGRGTMAALAYSGDGDLSSVTTLPGHQAPDPASGQMRSWERRVDVTVGVSTRQLTAIEHNAHDTNSRRRFVFAYQSSGGLLLTRASDPRSETIATTFEYGSGAQSSAIREITDREGHVWRWAYGIPDGAGTRRTTVTRPHVTDAAQTGVQTQLDVSARSAIGSYDGRRAGGNVVRVIDAGANLGQVERRYTWQANRLTGVTDGAGATTTATYNDLGLVTSIVRPSPNAQADAGVGAPAQAIVQRFTYRTVSARDYTAPRCLQPRDTSGAAVTTDAWCATVMELARVADADDALAGMPAAQRRITDYRHDANGRVTEVIERGITDPAPALNSPARVPPQAAPPADRVTSFGYYTQGALRLIDGPRLDADITTFGDLSSDPYGGYHPSGQPTHFTDAHGRIKRFSWTPYGELGKVIDRDGRVTTFVYDERGNPTSMTNPAAQRTAATYNALDLLASQTTPRGTASADAGDHTTAYAYDNTGRPETIRTPGAAVGDAPTETTIEYYPDGTKRRENRPTTTSTFAATVWDYWPDQSIKTVTSPAGSGEVAAIDYEYDRAGRVVKVREPSANAAGDRPETSMSYSPAGTLIRSEQTSAAATPRTVTFAYNAHGELVRTRGPRTLGTGAGVTQESQQRLDSFGEAFETRRLAGDAAAPRWLVTGFAYDQAGNLAVVDAPAGDSSPQQRLVTRYAYDVLNRLSAQLNDPVNPGRSVAYIYDNEGAQTRRRDRLEDGTILRDTVTTYNPNHTVWSTIATDIRTGQTLASCNNTQSGDALVSGHDADGNLTATRTVSGSSDCMGGTTLRGQTTSYDQRGWPASMSQSVRSPATGSMVTRSQTLQYRLDGIVTASNWTDHNATHSTSFASSPAGWWEEIRDATGKTSRATWFPSGASRLRSYGDDGQPSSRAAFSGELNLLAGIGAPDAFDGPTVTSASTYHPDGALMSLAWTRANGNQIRSHTGIQYDPGGQRTNENVSIVGATGATVGGSAAYTYDLADRLTSWTSPYPYSPTISARPTIAYTLDDAGNITRQLTTTGNTVRREATNTYVSGRIDRRTVNTPADGTTAATTQTDTFTYSQLGEERGRSSDLRVGTSPGRVELTTDLDPAGFTQRLDESRTGSADDPAKPGDDRGDVDYVYDMQDRVIVRTEVKNSTSKTTLYFYWGNGTGLAEEANGQGETTARYITNPSGHAVAQHTYRTDASGQRDLADPLGTLTWLLTDPDGNTATVLRHDGTVISQNAHDPYGNNDSGGTTPSPTIITTLGYQQAITDPTHGRTLLGGRQHDPDTGRFTSPDVFANGMQDLGVGVGAQTGNRYLFAAANPIAFDETGYDPACRGAGCGNSMYTGRTDNHRRIEERQRPAVSRGAASPSNHGRARQIDDMGGTYIAAAQVTDRYNSARHAAQCHGQCTPVDPVPALQLALGFCPHPVCVGANVGVSVVRRDASGAALAGVMGAGRGVPAVAKALTGKGSVPPRLRDPRRLFTRAQVDDALGQQGNVCLQCGEPLELSGARGHHVTRHADGGPTTEDNLAVLCPECHVDVHRP